MSEYDIRSPNVYRGAFTFTNSLKSILRFPFPFASDSYAVDVNVEPHNRDGESNAFKYLFDIDEHYVDEMNERAYVLSQDSSRCQVLPHMEDAEWEALELIMENLARDFGKDFRLQRNGTSWLWENGPLRKSDKFVFGDLGSLPYRPLEYITRQVQGDFVLLDQRDDTLWLDGGMVTEAFGWSFDFVLGMNWTDWHGPILKDHEREVIERARLLTMSLPGNRPQRRLNWITLVKPRLDRSLEAMPDWFRDDGKVTLGTVPDDLFFRVEFQQLYRLPRSHAILFVLRNYMLSFRDIARVRNWRMRLHRVLRDLDPNSERYGALVARDLAVNWLSRFDDGSRVEYGGAPELPLLDPTI